MPGTLDGLLIRPMSIADTAALQEISTLPGFMWGTNQIPSKTLEQRQRQVESMVTDRSTHALVAALDRKYESLGFEREGIQRCAMFRGGLFVDLLMMGRVRE